jgi:hypothetical protein
MRDDISCPSRSEGRGKEREDETEKMHAGY